MITVEEKRIQRKLARATVPVRLPWRIVVDTAEQQPFTFQGIKADASQHYRPIQVETVRRCLGRHPDSYGDYAIERQADNVILPCYVERKSLEDCQGTLLGFQDGHRARFEAELAKPSFAPVIALPPTMSILKLVPDAGIDV